MRLGASSLALRRRVVPHNLKAAAGAVASVVLFAAVGLAQDPAFLVKDIYTGPDPGASSLVQRGFVRSDPVVVGGTVYFTAYEREHGRELWKTDGTPEGTVLVKDTNPGNGDGIKSALVV